MDSQLNQVQVHTNHMDILQVGLNGPKFKAPHERSNESAEKFGIIVTVEGQIKDFVFNEKAKISDLIGAVNSQVGVDINLTCGGEHLNTRCIMDEDLSNYCNRNGALFCCSHRLQGGTGHRVTISIQDEKNVKDTEIDMNDERNIVVQRGRSEHSTEDKSRRSRTIHSRSHKSDTENKVKDSHKRAASAVRRAEYKLLEDKQKQLSEEIQLIEKERQYKKIEIDRLRIKRNEQELSVQRAIKDQEVQFNALKNQSSHFITSKSHSNPEVSTSLSLLSTSHSSVTYSTLDDSKRELDENDRNQQYDLRSWRGNWMCRGFYNEGNTCYQNSALQCLMHSVPFLKDLVNRYQQLRIGTVPHAVVVTSLIYHKSKKADLDTQRELSGCIDTFIHVFNKVFGVNSGSSTYQLPTALSAAEIRNAISKKKPFHSYRRQGDAFEYLMDIITECYDDRTPSTVFRGKMKLERICRCHIFPASNNFFALTLPIHNKASLEECIDMHLCNRSSLCPRCNHQISIKQTVEIYPEILILHLNRFRSNGRDTVKNASSLSNLPLHHPHKEFENYELYGVIRHIGDRSSGHYYAQIKVDMTWYEFDDSSVTIIEPPTSNGKEYVLLYRRNYNISF